MDTLDLIPVVRENPYWIGRLSACIGESSRWTTDKNIREDLRACLAEFIASPVPSEELRQTLRGYLK